MYRPVLIFTPLRLIYESTIVATIKYFEMMQSGITIGASRARKRRAAYFQEIDEHERNLANGRRILFLDFTMLRVSDR